MRKRYCCIFGAEINENIANKYHQMQKTRNNSFEKKYKSHLQVKIGNNKSDKIAETTSPTKYLQHTKSKKKSILN